MKRFALAGMLALAPLVAASKANAWWGGGCGGNGCGGGFTIGGSISISGFCKGWCNNGGCSSNFGPICGGGGGGGGLAPWYSYYPYDAYFQTPAPTGYPYWPAPMTPYPSPATTANVGSYPYGGTFVPTAAQVPSYWYGH
jgi:hypothetical protein